MTNLEERRQKLDAEKALVMARQVTIIMPHYIVLPECAEHCRRLRKVADEAKLMAIRYPDYQIVVVGDEHRRFGVCNVQAYFEGVLESQWPNATPSNPAFLHNPAPYAVSEKIKQALAHGAQDYNTLP